MIDFKGQVSLPFEVVLVTRDADGNPTGTKSYASDDPFKISQFFLRHKGKPKKKQPSGGKIIKAQGKAQAAFVDTTEREIPTDA